VNSYDNLKLHGYYIPSFNKKSNLMAIVVHGYQSKATDMIIIGQMYARMGFQVILTDLRGHGESQGTFTTFGHYEKYDLKKWINFATRTYGSDLEILIHGVSMGAAITMLSLGLDIPNNVKFLLLDSGFTEVGKTFTNTRRSKGLKIFYLGLNIITYSKHKYILRQIRPIKQMRKNTIPFLIIQGELDTAVPLSMAKKLYDVSLANKKDLLIVKNSKHALGFRDDFTLCEDTLYKCIKPIFNIKKTYTINNE
ncbi:MAG TPA: alpha/beta hydrolase, partial [Bacillota bacterium]|nr:alpha/beta hydrolase [Bacillota bacterium]